MNLLIEWPQIIVIFLICVRSVQNGVIASTRTGMAELIGAIIGVMLHPVMWFGLLYWGGFFTAP